MDTKNQFRWRGIAEIVGLAGIIGSLLFVGLQLQQDRELARIASFADYTEVNIALGELISDNRDVWIKGLDGDELSPSDRMVFETLARIYYRGKMVSFIRSQVLGGRAPQSVVNQTAFYLYQYPGLKWAFDEHSVQSESRNDAFSRTSDTTGFRSLVRAAYEDLQERAPPIPPRNYVVF